MNPKKPLIAHLPEGMPIPAVGHLSIPEHLARQLQAEDEYQGMLTGSVAAEFTGMREYKAFMQEIEALLTKHKVHRVDLFWKGPFMMVERPQQS